jgi:hypothetical protein
MTPKINLSVLPEVVDCHDVQGIEQTLVRHQHLLLDRLVDFSLFTLLVINRAKFYERVPKESNFLNLERLSNCAAASPEEIACSIEGKFRTLRCIMRY